MTDCPTHGAIDGLFCAKCNPPRPPIDPAVRARIAAALERARKGTRRFDDDEADEERAAIQDEDAPW